MNSTIYEQHSIPRLILTFSLPSIFALIVEMMTAVVDTAFAGHLDQSEAALSAMGLLSPLLAAFVALQTLFAVSTAVMISRYMGRNDAMSLNRYFQNGILMTFVISLGSSMLIFLFLEPVLAFSGIQGDPAVLARDYLHIILISNIFSAFGYTLTSSVRAFGHPKMEAFIVTLSVVINIAANAALTFGLQLGMTGIALGTLVSEIVCALLAVWFLVRKGYWFHVTAVSFKDTATMSFQMLKIGVAQTVIQLLAGMTAYIVNRQLVTIGGNGHVAVWNISNKLYMLALMPIIGITQAVQTIVAFFDGREDDGRKRQTVNYTVWYCLVYGTVVTAAVYLFGKSVLRLFTPDATLIASAFSISKVIFITFPLLGITYTVMMLLQVTEREFQAVLLGMTRQIITIIPLVLLLPVLFSTFPIAGIEPAFSIFFAMPAADLLTLAVAFFLFRKNLRGRLLAR